eukprot:2381559-Alexandrium_andersonii.AAC.1
MTFANRRTVQFTCLRQGVASGAGKPWQKKQCDSRPGKHIVQTGGGGDLEQSVARGPDTCKRAGCE